MTGLDVEIIRYHDKLKFKDFVVAITKLIPF